MITSPFSYHAPKTTLEAAKLLSECGDTAKLLAGGQSLIPLMKLRLAEPETLIDLGNISDLSYIKESKGALLIGPMTTYYDLMSSSLVQQNIPILSSAASLVADVQVRNQGTIGGSLSHADPAGDMPAVALALDVEFTVIRGNQKNKRVISVDNFFVDLLTTDIKYDELLVEIKVPIGGPNTVAAYEKIANKASRYAIVGVAAQITMKNGKCVNARVAVTGAGEKAVRATDTEQLLIGSEISNKVIVKASTVADKGIDCLQDIHASADYRAHLTRVAAQRAISKALEALH